MQYFIGVVAASITVVQNFVTIILYYLRRINWLLVWCTYTCENNVGALEDFLQTKNALKSCSTIFFYKKKNERKKFNSTPFNLFGMMAIATTHENVFFNSLKWNIVCNKVKYHEAFEKAFLSKSVLAYIEMRDIRNR